MKVAGVVGALVLLGGGAFAAAPKTYNKYGMNIKLAKDSTYRIVAAKSIETLIGEDPYELEDALIPYKVPKSKVISKHYKDIVDEDFVYKTLADGKELMISVDKAENATEATPVLFVFHGGSWQKGSRTSSSSITKTLAKEYGVTCVRVQYSFIGIESGVMFQDVIDDCKDAVNFVISHAAELNIDPERIGFMGQSAGGHLAAVMALAFSQTKLLIGNYGPYDLQYSSEYKRKAYEGKGNKSFENFRFALKDFDPEYIATVSPYHLAKAPVNFKAVLFQGTGDYTVLPPQASRFADKLRECGATDVQLVEFPYATHSLARSMYREQWYTQVIEAASTKL